MRSTSAVNEDGCGSTEADARLIAAAPAMLSLLESARAAITSGDGELATDVVREIGALLRQIVRVGDR